MHSPSSPPPTSSQPQSTMGGEYSFSKYDLNSKIMFTAIISLSSLILLVIFLHVYARWLIRRARRHAAHRRHLATIGNTHVHLTEQPKSGLDPSVIVTLPVSVFRHDMTKSNVDCSVCLSNFEDGEMVRILPNCKHNFHAECIDMWLEFQSTCPVCRTEAEPIRFVTESREGPVYGSGVEFELVTSRLLNSGEGTSKPIRLVTELREGPVDSSGVGFELMNSTLLNSGEGTSNDGNAKINGSSSRLSSLRRILSRDRSSWRSQDHVVEDLERQ